MTNGFSIPLDEQKEIIAEISHAPTPKNKKLIIKIRLARENMILEIERLIKGTWNLYIVKENQLDKNEKRIIARGLTTNKTEKIVESFAKICNQGQFGKTANMARNIEEGKRIIIKLLIDNQILAKKFIIK